jgi:uncharacterized protein
MERGADPTANNNIPAGCTPLKTASEAGHLEVVRHLLGHAGVRTAINHRHHRGRTALWYACSNGRGAIVRALLENGADPTIADKDGITPMAISKHLVSMIVLPSTRAAGSAWRRCR